MKEINEQVFKNTYLLFYDNYKKGNYVLSVYIDKNLNKRKKDICFYCIFKEKEKIEKEFTLAENESR